VNLHRVFRERNEHCAWRAKKNRPDPTLGERLIGRFTY